MLCYGSFVFILIKKSFIFYNSGSGLGQAIAKKLSSEGAIVLLTGRKKEALAETETIIRSNGGKTHS